jgi:hypothetical protein
MVEQRARAARRAFGAAKANAASPQTRQSELSLLHHSAVGEDVFLFPSEKIEL